MYFYLDSGSIADPLQKAEKAAKPKLRQHLTGPQVGNFSVVIMFPAT
jgi:hypothetical protein